jgi:gluconokinase
MTFHRDRFKENEMVIVVMGVSGVGKTTIGRRLSSELGWPFVDADDLHPATNVEKMRRGTPLDESDRAPWIAKVRAEVERLLAHPGNGVVACSALRAADRARLRLDPRQMKFVHLVGDPAVIAQRLSTRGPHFMKAGLLPTQFAALEPPKDALTIDVRQTPEEAVLAIRTALGR